MRCDVEELLPSLRRARDLAVIVEERGKRVLCRFRHALTRRTIYENMLAFDARRTHEQILTTLETIGDPERHIDELAYHAWEAKDDVRSRSYNERAGNAALTVRALPEAATNFERALEASSHSGDRARLLTALGSVGQLQGRLSDAIERFEEALALRLCRNEYDAAAPIVGSIAGDRYNLGDESGLVHSRIFLDEYGDRLNHTARAGLAVFIARILSVRYDFEPVERLLSGVSPEQLAPRVRQNYVITQVNRYTYRGDVSAWEHCVREFSSFAATVPEFLRIMALYTIGQTGTYLAAHDSTERALDEADRLVAQFGFGGIDVFGVAVRASYLWHRGKLDAARRCVERVLEAGEPYVARAVAAYVAPMLALALGDDALATRSLTKDVTSIADSGACDAEPLCGARGTWLAGRGRLLEAQRDLRLGLSTVKASTPFSTTLLISCARYLEGDELARVAELTAPSNLHREDAVGRANASFVTALIAQRNGDVSAAERFGTLAAGDYAALGWPMLEAQALEAAGRPNEALARYEECGAVAHVRRLAPPAPERMASGGNYPLSRSEHAVAQLVTRGLTNMAIADTLSVTPKTVEKHLSSIFVKLEIRSRAQIAAFMSREGREHASRSE